VCTTFFCVPAFQSPALISSLVLPELTMDESKKKHRREEEEEDKTRGHV